MKYRIGDWVLVRFPHEETGKQRKLSQPWHGPFRVVSCDNPDVTVVKTYFPQDGQIQMHQTRVTPCPDDFPAGYYWYGRKRHSPGRPPKWLETLADVSQQIEADDLTKESMMLEPTEPETVSESEAESEAEVEHRPDEDVHVTPEPESNRAQSNRYTLRSHVKPPARLMEVRLRFWQKRFDRRQACCYIYSWFHTLTASSLRGLQLVSHIISGLRDILNLQLDSQTYGNV